MSTRVDAPPSFLRLLRLYTWACVALFLLTALLAGIASTGGPDREIAAGYTAFFLFLFGSLPAHVLGIILHVFYLFSYRDTKYIVFQCAYYVVWVIIHLIVFFPFIKSTSTEFYDNLSYSIISHKEKDLIEQIRFQHDQEKIRQLIDQGVDVNATDNQFGFSALIWAANKSDIQVLEMLLEAGANPNYHPQIQSTLGPRNLFTAPQMTALTNAVSVKDATDRIQRARLLLSFAADPDAGKPILLACALGDLEVIALLQEAGANLFEKDAHGRTCAHLAARENHVAVLQLLSEQHFDFTQRTKYTLTPLDAAIQDWKDMAILYLMQQGLRSDREHFIKRYLDKAPDSVEKEQIVNLIHTLE